MPSRSRSAAAIETAPLPRVPAPLKLGEAHGNVQLLSNILVLEKPPTARSGLPSRLRSSAATNIGLAKPTTKLVADPKLPVPVPSSTVASLETLLAVTRSWIPSPLKSLTATL